MKKLFIVTAITILQVLGVFASAAITIDTITVGYPGNVAETMSYGSNPRRQGSVSYTYDIGKYEVTSAQYCAFLNAVAKTDTYGLYRVDMWASIYGCKIQRSGSSGNYSYSIASDRAKRPVNFVSFWDCCRFANWLHNGQPTGLQDATTTERGAYTLDGYTSYNGLEIKRNSNWKWAVTSKDEWHKAAYYKGGGTNAGYWKYPTRSDTIPSNKLVESTDPGNNATYYNNGYTITFPWLTEVGSHENSCSAYGTYDQCGNVSEWSEDIARVFNEFVMRDHFGGDFRSQHIGKDITWDYDTSEIEDDFIGFRVVQAVPEPSSIITLLGSITGFICIIRRRA